MALDDPTARARILDAADRLFYERGIQAVGMDAIRAASGVSLKRLYQLYPAKDRLIEAYLEQRDRQWRIMLARFVDRYDAPRDRLLAVFDFLDDWFRRPAFRGSAVVNAFGELAGISPKVAELARDHQARVRRYLRGLAEAAALSDPDSAAEQLLILSEGATTAAAVEGSPEPARRAKQLAGLLVARP